MTHTEATPRNRAFVPAPKFFFTMGCHDEIPIEEFRRELQLVMNLVNRAYHQNKYKTFESIGGEPLSLNRLGIDFGPGGRQRIEAKRDSVRAFQPKNTDNPGDRVATKIDDTVTSISGACTSQIEVSKDPSAVREGASSAPACGQTVAWELPVVADKSSETPVSESTELERQSEDFPATALQDEYIGNSASADTVPWVPTNDVPACSTSRLDADDPGDGARQSQLDHMSQQALADENLPKYPPPAQAVAVTTAKKVNRSLHAQPDFEHVQHEFDANGLSLKMLWDQYRQSHPNKRTYKYSQFCNRFNDWTTSHPSTALSQGP